MLKQTVIVIVLVLPVGTDQEVTVAGNRHFVL
jgi:hypothetical protein